MSSPSRRTLPSGAGNAWSRACRTRAGFAVWQWLTIRAGIPVITAATSDLFVPQAANWDALGGISFQKGCYTGQEIVARTQYLGRLKERSLLAHLDGAPPAPGERSYSATFGDQSCGTVVNAAASPDGGSDLLAVLQLAAARKRRRAILRPPTARSVASCRFPTRCPAPRRRAVAEA